MSHKLVCLGCFRVENIGTDFSGFPPKGKVCPECSHPLIFLPHRFRPPKKSDIKGWELVKFLISEGFPFQHIYQEGSSEYSKKASNNFVSYPTSMAEAKEFVKKYQKYKVTKIEHW